MQAKNADYCGGSGDPYANFRISATFGIHPVMGIILRMTDKLQRIRAFVTNGNLAVKTESFEDACDDMVNYAILIKGMLRDSANGEHSSVPENPEDRRIETILEHDECECGHRMVFHHKYGMICENCDPVAFDYASHETLFPQR